MKILLFLGLTSLFFVEEPSYNFGGRYTKEGKVTLTIDVRDGSYWATFATENTPNASPCELSAKASVKNGTLRIRTTREQPAFTLRISATDNTRKMVVRGLRRSDQNSLMRFCKDGGSLAGEYTRGP